MNNALTEDETKLLRILMINFLLSGDATREEEALMLSITQKLEGGVSASNHLLYQYDEVTKRFNDAIGRVYLLE
ncbi:hypothetical protein Q2838_000311 [Escherichia coli]|nr:hypothetical protein [Escherichia coli]EGO7974154.1 hypothetical protein [Escherichia coli]EGO7979697.1 hypothetical protein [Escherichia coli]EGO8001880.1 hypothetical protein [Escherichia coli]EJK7921435.1 hypothetical protein [Escherichia coli]